MTKSYHPPIPVAGIVYDLAHLSPFEMAVTSHKVGRDLRIRVRFTDHCFSDL